MAVFTMKKYKGGQKKKDSEKVIWCHLDKHLLAGGRCKCKTVWSAKHTHTHTKHKKPRRAP